MWINQLGAVLRSGHILLVLDNCEHVVPGCRALLDQLLSSCADLKVLSTSRIPLGLATERIWGVPPLGDGSAVDGNATDAMALFVDRAAGVAPGYALTELNRLTLAEICATLRGSPLAIELAASWIRVLSPRDLLASLARDHTTVASDSADFVEERHRSMQAVLDSSWRWLGSTDRSVIEALGVFVGGFTLEAAEAVADADLGTLARLSQLALIQRLPDPYGGSRYHVHELVRSYALDRLERRKEVRARHLSYFLGVVDTTGAARTTPVVPQWSDPVAAEHANIDAALLWALDRGDAESAQRLAVGLDHFWLFRQYFFEHRVGRLEEALALPGPTATHAAARARAQALLTLGRRHFVTDPGQSRSDCTRAQRLFQQIGDAASVAACIRDRGIVKLLVGDHQGCRRDCLRSLASCRSRGDELGAAWCLETIGTAALLGGDSSEARARLTEAAASFAALDFPQGACYAEIDLALASQIGGEWLESVDACSRALDYQRRYRLQASSADLLEVVARQCVELGLMDEWRSPVRRGSQLALVEPHGGVVSRHPPLQPRRSGSPASWGASLDRGIRDRPPARARSCDSGRRRATSRPPTRSRSQPGRIVAPRGRDPSAGGRRQRRPGHRQSFGAERPHDPHAHLRSIYRKLGVGSRTAAIAAAGLVTPRAAHSAPKPGD